MPIGLSSFNATDKREDVLSILKDISPNTDNYFVSNLKVSPDATNTIHEWPVYNTDRPTSVTMVVEGADASIQDHTTPARSNNRVGIVDEVVQVTTTEMGISTLTNEDPQTFQKRNALTRLKAKMEFLTINGAYATGASGVAAQMAGIDGMISTNVTAMSSGTSFSEVILNDMIQESWTAVGAQYVADLLLCPVVIKRRIASFTTNNTRNIDASAKKLDKEVRVYDSEVGPSVMIIPHKDVRAAAGTLTVYALREDLFSHSFLSNVGRPQWSELAKTGHAVKGMYSAQFTVVSHAQSASVKRSGFNTGL